MKRYVVCGFALVGFASATFQSCQADDDKGDSDTKSLGNLANEASGEEQTINYCTGSNAVNGGLKVPVGAIRGANSEALKTAVTQTLTAVPSSVTFAFFQLGGVVELRDNALQACSNSLGPNDDPAIEGACLTMDTVAQSLTIILSPSEKAIYHGLTRAMGVFYAMGIARASRSADDSLVYQEPDAEIISGWNDVRNIFLTELPEDVAQNEVLTSSTAARIYAEAFDSYYCSSQTRKDTERFPLTMAAFAKTTDQIAAIDASLEKALKTRVVSDFKVLSSIGGAQKRLAALVQWGVEYNLKGDGEAALGGSEPSSFGLVQAKGGAPIKAGAAPVKAGQTQFATKGGQQQKGGIGQQQVFGQQGGSCGGCSGAKTVTKAVAKPKVAAPSAPLPKVGPMPAAPVSPSAPASDPAPLSPPTYEYALFDNIEAL